MNKLFVYGIFIDEYHRNNYGMTNPRYDVVLDYATVRAYGDIVQAIPASSYFGVALTGLVVDVDPNYWGRIDQLEQGYERIKVKTERGVQTYMYVGQ